ncbi:MAG: hypothetical protein OZ921_02980 [Sorangiineae bacterium]|nr:hypothetical protein [Polyangiaceae bacterium]MEB2321452.1 hypothetical protein [Sorangiineae bacterium]
MRHPAPREPRRSALCRCAPHLLGVAATCAATLLATPSAKAAGPLSAPAEPSSTRWYGEQTLIADGASLAVFGLGASTRSLSGFMAVGAIGYALAAPAVHLGHGRVGTAFLDLGQRLAIPGLFGLGGALVACQGGNSTGESFCGLTGFALGLGVGVPAAIAIDAALLAREEVPATPAHTMMLAPMVSHTGGGLGVIGTF